ncbi:ATP-dependent RNA helicase DHX8 [Lophium mytilinum]|uniref:ATP-dependent RNA helicase DHX8 n=1 Tax=Lophium mytilinum TaxID=390894 RepID=A0A6A6R6T0_9PEZI|nr:ATP-dependent RNA helicase DHX8 [Lophium mytilinum]
MSVYSPNYHLTANKKRNRPQIANPKVASMASPIATTTTTPTTTSKTPTPHRQIRATYDTTAITVYQAYSSSIASAAVKYQKLSASPDFSFTRMTWIKPSWSWMMYRSGYSYKDARQTNILALKMRHEDFEALLKTAVLAHGPAPTKGQEGDEEDKLEKRKRSERVVVQWDPERSFRIGKLEHRSIQIGIPRALVERWVEEGIVGIEDVTERARALKKVVEEEKDVTNEELLERGLIPDERVYEVPERLRKILGMDEV